MIRSARRRRDGSEGRRCRNWGTVRSVIYLLAGRKGVSLQCSSASMSAKAMVTSPAWYRRATCAPANARIIRDGGMDRFGRCGAALCARAVDGALALIRESSFNRTAFWFLWSKTGESTARCAKSTLRISARSMGIFCRASTLAWSRRPSMPSFRAAMAPAWRHGIGHLCMPAMSFGAVFIRSLLALRIE